MEHLVSIEEFNNIQKNNLKKIKKIKELKILDYETDDGLPCINVKLTDQDNKKYTFFVGWINYKEMGHWQYACKHPEAEEFVVNYIKRRLKQGR